ncbi:GNAT family N-acetyltransferase [Mariniluteicoccus flavus]
MIRPVTIRPATEHDLPALTELYNHYIRETVATFAITPLTVNERRPWFAKFGADGPAQCLVAIDEESEELLGYCSTGQVRPLEAYAGSVEVSVYLSPECTGRGIGDRLYAALFPRLRGVHRAYACIAVPNEGSIALHRKHGFRSVGRWAEAGRKFDRWIDVEWMEKRL